MLVWLTIAAVVLLKLWDVQGKLNQFCGRQVLHQDKRAICSFWRLQELVLFMERNFLHCNYLSSNPPSQLAGLSSTHFNCSACLLFKRTKKYSVIPFRMPLAAPGIPAIWETLFIRKYSSQFSVVKFVVWQKSNQSFDATVMLSLTMVLAQTSNWSLDRVLLPNMQILEGKHGNQGYYTVPGKWNPPLPTILLA